MATRPKQSSRRVTSPKTRKVVNVGDIRLTSNQKAALTKKIKQKDGLTATELLRQTAKDWEVVPENAKAVMVYDAYFEPSDLSPSGYVFKSVTDCKDDERYKAGKKIKNGIHNQMIYSLSKSMKVGSRNKLFVQCDCEFFLYNCEYSLTRWGSSEIKYSNGQPAKIKNPQNKPWVCKHIFKCLAILKANGK